MASTVRPQGRKMVSPGQAVGSPVKREQAGPSTPTPKAKAGRRVDLVASPPPGRGRGDTKATPVKTKRSQKPDKTAKGLAAEQARVPRPSPAAKTDKDGVPVTKPSPRRRRGGRGNWWDTRLTKRTKANKGDADTGIDATSVGSGQTLAPGRSPADKAEPDSTPAGLYTHQRGTNRGPTTPTKKRVGASESFPDSPLSEQVRDLEKNEALQRSRGLELEMENHQLNEDVTQLDAELSSALADVTRLESANRVLLHSRKQVAKKLGETTDALHEERARAEGFRVAAKQEDAVRAALAAREKVLDYELRKFRTALAAAFKLLPSLEDQISFRQLVLRTDEYLRDKMARREAENGPVDAPGPASAGAFEAQGANHGNQGDPEPSPDPNLGPNTPGGMAEFDEAKPATAQPAPATTPTGADRAQKRRRDDTPHGWWTESQFDVPLAKRRGNI